MKKEVEKIEVEKMVGFDYGLDSSSAVVTNDEMADVKEVFDMMQREEKLSVRFSKTKENIPCAWIESKVRECFSMSLNNERYHWLLNYLINGATGEIGNFSKVVNPTENVDFQWEVMKAFIAAGRIIQYTPLFRIRTDKISAISACRKGKVMFYIDRTPAVMDYLREHKQCI